MKDLKVAWEYRSGDGEGHIQCNPVIVGDTLYAPTPGEYLVALDARTGVEKWRFKGEGRPAHRGLVYWSGDGTNAARLLVAVGKELWAIDPDTGKAIESFGDGGKVASGQAVVAGAIFKNVFVIPGYEGDVWGFDIVSGARLWTFHTRPSGAEYGADSWSTVEEAANCWGGMALDEERGIAYISMGLPKTNFAGSAPQGTKSVCELCHRAGRPHGRA